MNGVLTGIGAIAGRARTASELGAALARVREVGPLAADVEPSAFDAAAVLGGRGLKRLDACTQLALAVAAEALESAKLDPAALEALAPRIGLIVSCNLGVLDTVRRVAATVRDGGSRMLSPVDLPNASPNVAASHVAIRYGLRGPNLTVASGAAGGLEAALQADLLLEADRADCVLVIGVEDLRGVAGDLVRASFAAETDAVLGSGAAALVMERAEVAERRGAARWGRIEAYASAQPTDGDDAAAARRALLETTARAGGPPGLTLVNDPGVGPARDAERRALLDAEECRGTPRAALKARLGESYGAAGVFNLVAAALALQSERVFASPAEWRGPDALEAAAPLVTRARPFRASRVLALGGGLGEPWIAAQVARP